MPELTIVNAARLPCPPAEAVALVTAGRGSLAPVLGDAACRLRLLGAAIQWERVLLAVRGGLPVGYCALKYAGRGPFAARAASFRAEFGALRGAFNYAVFRAAEWREQRYPFFIYGLRVNKAARRQGVARALLNAACEQARDAGASAVHLEVLRGNQAARQLFSQAGFVPAGGWPGPLCLRKEVAYGG